MNVFILGVKIIAAEELHPIPGYSRDRQYMFLRFYIATDSFLSHYRRDS